jgi:hypothetical protein
VKLPDFEAGCGNCQAVPTQGREIERKKSGEKEEEELTIE